MLAATWPPDLFVKFRMAAKTVTRMATLPILLVVVVAIVMTCSEAKLGKLKETNMVFCMHDIESGTNITTFPVAGIPNKRYTVVEFGTIAAIDDLLTEGYSRDSTQVGRAHGIYVNSALDGSDFHFLMSLLFANERLNGSTLEIQGSDRFFEKYREVSVVSGTGKFRTGKGYAILETVYLDLGGLNAIIKWNLTVFRY